MHFHIQVSTKLLLAVLMTKTFQTPDFCHLIHLFGLAGPIQIATARFVVRGVGIVFFAALRSRTSMHFTLIGI
jgi:hypothetical protein